MHQFQAGLMHLQRTAPLALKNWAEWQACIPEARQSQQAAALLPPVEYMRWCCETIWRDWGAADAAAAAAALAMSVAGGG